MPLFGYFLVTDQRDSASFLTKHLQIPSTQRDLTTDNSSLTYSQSLAMAPWNRKGLGFLTGILPASRKKAANAASWSPQPIMQRFHRFLGLAQQAPDWYPARLREELAERREAKRRIDKLSETADIFYIISRSHYDGHPVRSLPPFRFRHVFVYGYIVPKLSSRFLFYRTAAYFCGCRNIKSVREVVNPAKDHKLEQVASRNEVDRDTFLRVCRRLRRVWVFFP
ncbi:hypothetical protein PT974_01376 [Cladobotryum mycophilum]|uniref:Uncharacterized protein n=1 Tax=Cladobotryum mycophilum TaxID=491253 RepID=A0ABR0T4U6_9HYPO